MAALHLVDPDLLPFTDAEPAPLPRAVLYVRRLRFSWTRIWG